MAGINKAIIIGRVGRDPEIRYTQSGKAVCSFSVATSEQWKGQDGGQREKTEWHNVTAWDRLAEICGKYVVKGMLVYIDGKLQTQKYDKDGQTHYKTEIIAQNMQMLSKKEGGDDGQSSQSDYQNPPDLPPVAQRQGDFPGPGSDDDSDGIPF